MLWAKLSLFAIATVSGVLGAVADVYLNKWAKYESLWHLAQGYVFWNLAMIGFIYLLRREKLAEVVIIFMVANSLVVLAASRFYFAETISVRQWVGILVALAGVLVMEWK